jgi:hypothetical protein
MEQNKQYNKEIFVKDYFKIHNFYANIYGKDKTIIFQAETAKVTADASGSWDGAVSLPFQIAISLLKIPPKEEEMTIEYLDGKLKIGPLKLAATHYV